MEVMMRRAKRADAEAINVIYNQAIDDGDACLEISHCTLEDRLEWMSRHNKRYPVYVGECEGQVICWVALSRYREGYAYDGVVELSVFVERSMRHQGLGGMLLKFVERQAVKLGHHKILFGVYASNIAALHVYRRNGYRDVGVFRNHGYYKGRLHDIIYMERLLPVKIDDLNQYYFDNYECYQKYFQQLQEQLEAQMQRNGMVRSPDNPEMWVPEDGEPNYVDDWNGQTVRLVKLEDAAGHKAKNKTEQEETEAQDDGDHTGDASSEAATAEERQEDAAEPAEHELPEAPPRQKPVAVPCKQEASAKLPQKDMAAQNQPQQSQEAAPIPSRDGVQEGENPGVEQKVPVMAGAQRTAKEAEAEDRGQKTEKQELQKGGRLKPDVLFDLFAEEEDEDDLPAPKMPKIMQESPANKEKKGFLGIFFKGKRAKSGDDSEPMDNQLLWNDVFGGDDTPDNE